MVSFLCYFNFGIWHFPNRVHQWDTFHYYVGSKYFKELSYDRLYECVAVADSEAPGLRRRVELRKVMNLRTNMMEGTQQILAHPERLQGSLLDAALGGFQERRRPFPGQARRQALGGGADRPRLQRLAGLEHPGDDAGEHRPGVGQANRRADLDGSAVHRRAVADEPVGVRLADDMRRAGGVRHEFPVTLLLDGRRLPALGLAVLFRGRDLPGEEGPTVAGRLLPRLFDAAAHLPGVRVHGADPGGAAADVGDARARRSALAAGTRPRLADRHHDKGVEKNVPELVWNVLRIYKPKPLTTVRELFSRVDRRYLSLFGGAALAIATLVPISFATSSGIAGYKAFKFNTNKHKETPLTNHMGLRTVVTYSPSEAGRSLQNSRLEDPWGTWKRAKVATFKRRFPLYLLFVAGFVGMLFAGLRRPSRGSPARWDR